MNDAQTTESQSFSISFIRNITDKLARLAWFIAVYRLLNWIVLIPPDVWDYFHSRPKYQRFPLGRDFLPDSEARPFLMPEPADR